MQAMPRRMACYSIPPVVLDPSQSRLERWAHEDWVLLVLAPLSSRPRAGVFVHETRSDVCAKQAYIMALGRCRLAVMQAKYEQARNEANMSALSRTRWGSGFPTNERVHVSTIGAREDGHARCRLTRSLVG